MKWFCKFITWSVYVSRVIYCNLDLSGHLQDQYDSVVCSLMAHRIKHLLGVKEETSEMSSEHYENQAATKRIKYDNSLAAESKAGMWNMKSCKIAV